ncbi:hypothetical protein AX16_003818 [Volvariella volvacea WC 439]|nr:hypothetical protein AX16_003818 [Volvariella volvacea WC 439]
MGAVLSILWHHLFYADLNGSAGEHGMDAGNNSIQSDCDQSLAVKEHPSSSRQGSSTVTNTPNANEGPRGMVTRTENEALDETVIPTDQFANAKIMNFGVMSVGTSTVNYKLSEDPELLKRYREGKDNSLTHFSVSDLHLI